MTTPTPTQIEDNDKPVVIEAPEQDPNFEPSSDDEIIGDDDDTPAPAPAPLPDEQKNQRDYSFLKEYPDDEKVFRGHAPNPIFNWAKERLPKLYEAAKKAQELEQKIKEYETAKQPAAYYEHPDGYVLDPKYNEAALNFRLVSEEEQHWVNQLKNIKQGLPWQDIIGRDESGRLKLSEPTEVSSEEDKVNLEIEIQRLLQTAGQYKSQFATQIQQLKQQHATAYQNEVEYLNSELKKYFPWQADPTKLDSEIVIDEKGTKLKIRDALNHALDYILPHHRKHPLATVYSNLAVTNVIANQTIRQLSQRVAELERMVEDVKKAEPGPSMQKSGGVKKQKASTQNTWDFGEDAIGSDDV